MLKLFATGFLLIFIATGIIGGCGGGGSGRDLNCKRELGNRFAFCNPDSNPGNCCELTSAFGLLQTSCYPEIGVCCADGLALCPLVDVCVKNSSQCPNQEEPIKSGISISKVRQSSCFGTASNADLEGIAFGPVGTTVSYFSPEFPQINNAVFCQSWTGFTIGEPGCTRLDSDPSATYWRIAIGLNIFEPTPEFDLIISANGSSVTYTQMPCP